MCVYARKPVNMCESGYTTILIYSLRVCACVRACVRVWGVGGGWGGGGACVNACVRAGDSVSARVFVFQCVSVSLCFALLNMISNVLFCY